MTAIRIADFDTWRPGYGGSSVRVLQAGTSTLASIFTDEALTIAADNPVTLATRLDGGISYGKFQFPLYIGSAYELLIDNIDQTGVTRPPLTSLDGQDASEAVVTVTGGTQAIALEDMFARRIDVRDYGEFIIVGGPGASASTNNATLTAAIGAASAVGGYVEIPAGTYTITAITVPEGVVLRGQGRAVTTLVSTTAGNVVTLSGDRAGMTRMTLDGSTLVGASVGVYAVAINEIVLDDCEIKRFETGLYRKGGSRCDWRDFYISNCVTGYKAHGDSASGLGAALRFNRWLSGKVELCTTAGIDLKNIDSAVEYNDFPGVTFDTNTGVAVKITGARYSTFPSCDWTANTGNLTVQDGSPVTAINTVIGLTFSDGQMDGGTLTFSGTYRSVIFRRMVMSSNTITINAPGQNIPVEDCIVANPTISGVPSCWLYRQTKDVGAALVTTSDNSAHKAWALTLASGQKVYLEGRVIGRQRNGINTGFYHISVSAGRLGASLAYDTQTANFTAGQILTGATSGATARITVDVDGGATGTLTLQDIVGTFVDNEVITDPLGGSALANGAISETNAALVGAITSIRAAQETDAAWNAVFAANGSQIELQVTGNTSQTVEWTVDVQVTQEQGSALTAAAASAVTLAYNSRTGGAFAAGQTVSGITSGAHATVVADAPSGTAGTLTLSGVSGSFQSGEVVVVGVSGTRATVN